MACEHETFVAKKGLMFHIDFSKQCLLLTMTQKSFNMHKNNTDSRISILYRQPQLESQIDPVFHVGRSSLSKRCIFIFYVRRV